MSTLRFDWVELHNFKSYRGTHRFNFPATPGLYLITGKNLVQPRLGANGVGKSSLLDAAFWAFYGRTPRGLRAGDIISHGESSAYVALEFWIGNEDYTIRRGQAPNSLTICDHKALTRQISQDELTKLIRLTPSQFLYSVLLPQFGTAFLDLAPTAALTVFSEIMDLDFWLEKSVHADITARAIAKHIEARDYQISKQEGQFELLEVELTTLEKQIVTDHSKTVAGFEAKLAKMTQKAQTAQANWQKLNATKILAEADIAHTIETIENIGKLEAKCPTCLQTVSSDHLRYEKRRLGSYLTSLKTHHRATVGQYELAKTTLRALEGDIAAVNRNLNDFKRKQAEYEAVAAMVSQKQNQLADLETSLSKLLNEADELKIKHGVTNFWVAGFKRIRLFLIDETLRQLELEVNNNLASLGLPDWRIEFDVERETKSGGISKGFVVLVYAPLAEKPVRLEAWSGGETQRLRLAGDLGLANLIMDRAGLTNTLEVYDEPSAHLSQEGLLDLLDTLQQRAVDHDKVILVVDHHALDYGFDGTFTVTKGKGGSSIAAT